MKNAISIILVLVLAYMLFSKFIPKRGIEKDELAPNINAKLIDGKDFQLSDLKGSYVMLDFWGSWCGPCIGEAGSIVALNKKYKDSTFSDGHDFKMVSIALERNDKSWKRVADRFGFDWEHQIVDISRYVATSDIGGLYGVKDIPSKFLIGPEGQFVIVKGSLTQIDKYLSEMTL